MENVTLALALLLGAGFAAAKIGQHFRLPSVTGYIVAGLLLGPSGFGLITGSSVGHRLEHFTQIALMLIAFGIGEHLEFKRMLYTARKLMAVCLGETACSFVLVYGGCRAVAMALGFGGGEWSGTDYFILALFLGAISIATAPASTLHVMREVQAAGPMTSMVLQVVALNNALAIMAFSVAAATAGQLVDSGSHSLLAAGLGSLSRVFLSLLLGIFAGLVMDFVSHRLKSGGEMLTTGLTLLLLCGESARLLALSPLLAGMAAGFTIVNRDHRDVRLFRVINAFEPPIFVLFFTLAGAHLDISVLKVAGWLGIAYFLFRAAGKYCGAFLGASVSKANANIRHFLGLTLIPQAGVAIGLVFLLSGEPSFDKYSGILTTVVLAAVFLAEIVGPVMARVAVEKAGETAEAMRPTQDGKGRSGAKKEREQHLVPWSWEKLRQADQPAGTVVFGASRSKTVGGLARIAALLAHYYKARPLAVRVVPPSCEGEQCALDHSLFLIEEKETASLGYELATSVIREENVPEALALAAEQTRAHSVILGYPIGGSHQEMVRVVERVATKVSCPVVIVRFIGVLHTERILVPIVNSRELTVVRDLLRALAGVGRHRITLLRLMPSYIDEEGLEFAEDRMVDWAFETGLTPFVFCRAVATEARQETVLKEAEEHDLVIMASNQAQGIQRLFFGSLASDIAQQCQKPMIIVHVPDLTARD